MADSNVFMRAFGSFDEPLKQGNYLNTTDKINRATKLVIRSFFDHGFKQTFQNNQDTIMLTLQIKERWDQFCSCIDLEIKNLNNQTAVWDTLHFCVMHKLHHTSHNSNSEDDFIVQKTVVDIACIILEFIKNIDLNISSNGISPLLFALNHNLDDSILSILGYSGAHFLVSEGSVAMTAIVKSSYDTMNQILLSKGKLECINSRIINCNGGTALHYACTENDAQILYRNVHLLLLAGVNPLIRNKNSLSPRDILKQRFHGRYTEIDRTISYLYKIEQIYVNRSYDT